MILIAWGMLLLTGCSGTSSEAPPSDPPGADDAVRESAAAERIETEETAPAFRGPEDVSFETQEDLSPEAWRIQWLTGFDDSFVEKSPDDGNGSWSVADTSNQCDILFYQGSVGDLDYTRDDRTLSDDYLFATFEGASREDVAANAYDDVVPRLSDDGSTLPMRTLWGYTADGTSYLSSARMFRSAGGGLWIGIFCPAGAEAAEEYEKLKGSFLAVDIGPANG